MRRPRPACRFLPPPLLAALLLAAVLILPACRSIQRPERVQTAPARVSPVVRGSGSGLEVWYWVVGDKPIERRIPSKPLSERTPPPRIGPEASAAAEDFTIRKPKAPEEPVEPAPEASDEPPPPAFTITDDRTELDELLAPFADRPLPFPDDVVRLWREAGFRILNVPRAELEGIESRLRFIAPVQRQWMGELPAWTDIAQGAWSERSRRVMVGDLPVRLEPGRLRLLARCWTAPIPAVDGPRGGLRLELIPQHEPLQTEEQRMLIAAGVLSSAEAKGVLFERLSAATMLTGDDCLVIVPLSRYTVEPIEGPLPGQDPTLGEAMLTRPVSERSARARAVIVLLPRVAERFELLR